MEFVIGTHNKNKVEEFERILAPLGIRVTTAQLTEVEETGITLEENAFLKANSACRETGKPAVADDSGLMVEMLGGAPGVYSSRYAGEGAPPSACVKKLLSAMKNVPEEKRGAKFVCSICCVFPNGDVIRASGECAGKIAFAPSGDGGFGYDPVFLVGGRSFAEFLPEEKDDVSHRGQALRRFAEELKKYKEQKHADK